MQMVATGDRLQRPHPLGIGSEIGGKAVIVAHCREMPRRSSSAFAGWRAPGWLRVCPLS
jgi:hypothetical protein